MKMKRTDGRWFFLLTAALALTVAAEYAAFRMLRVPVLLAVLLCAALLTLSALRRSRMAAAVVLLFAAQGMALLCVRHSAVMLAVTVSAVCAAALLVFFRWQRRLAGRPARLRTAVCLAAGLVFLTLTFTAFVPDLFSRAVQGNVMGRTAEESVQTRADGVTAYRNLPYPSDAPNSTMDVFVSPQGRGTVVYIHGGGFVMGDKDTAGQNAYLNAWLDAGYHVVAVNYALAPQYRYPTAIRQCAAALCQLAKTGPALGLDCDRLLLVGDSAGGQLAGQLALIQSDPAYAAKLGVSPADVTVRGYISICGLVDPPRFSDTGFLFADWAHHQWGASYFGTADFEASGAANEASILLHAGPGFPPSFLSDGNFATFDRQNADLADRLESLGVAVTRDFVPRSEARLAHVYQLAVDTDPYAKASFERQLAFAGQAVSG